MVVPTFSNIIERNRSATELNMFATAIQLARSEAIKRSSVVSVVAIAPDDSNEFGGGWCVVPSTNPCTGPDVIRTFPALAVATLDDPNDRDHIPFNAFGELHDETPRGLLYCGPKKDRRITITNIGRTTTKKHSC